MGGAGGGGAGWNISDGFSVLAISLPSYSMLPNKFFYYDVCPIFGVRMLKVCDIFHALQP